MTQNEIDVDRIQLKKTRFPCLIVFTMLFRALAGSSGAIKNVFIVPS